MMMNTAYSIDSNHPFYPMLFARSNYVDGVTSKTVEDKTYEYNKLPYFSEVNDLEKTVKGKKLVAMEYARYWHGYLVYLRPLLVSFNYMEVEILSYILHIGLFLVFTY